MKIFMLFLLALTAGCLQSTPTVNHPVEKASLFTPGEMAEGAPPELAHWGKLVGQWSTTEESLKTDGSGWEPSKGADWDFFWAFGGWGIQDTYYSPPLKDALDDENTRQRGINLRIYNPTENKWVMAWLTVSSTKPSTFTATSTDEEIVMQADVLNPQGFHRRITFFDITDSTFEWKLEWSKDREQWREVYRIHGTRKPV